MSVSSPTEGSQSQGATEGAGAGGPGVLPEPQVRAMFDRIARVYDRMNGVMTAGLHHTWRRRAADLAELEPGGRVLDIATGTGDLAFELGHRVAPDGLVVGADFSENMLEIARGKREALRLLTSAPAGVELRFEQANALALPYADDEFDAATVGFGARNFSDLPRGLSEMTRVVRPGGKVVVLEITTPTEGLTALALHVWFDQIVPLVGRVAGDADAYNYLPSSVRRFPPPRELAATMAAAGLRDVRYILTAGGIIALHVGTVMG
ncbi:MAG TPA: bifunctional demethylmenaquinone methyltransferase/2-methoxy-6-polyprenyl-1,4-benzoquinol methylase UbiE [Solirubrobacteraceae bacterium]|nr:bifunctional demethylmenaquinone methyltransferase/2-methoxy-6-polyprenyl-1,4-benzoquinol methylase UbiE [Solirubrobacteraceae bacterium]